MMTEALAECHPGAAGTKMKNMGTICLNRS